MIHIVHAERNKTIQNLYSKFEKYYKKHGQNLRYAEESFEGGSNLSVESVAATSKFLFFFILYLFVDIFGVFYVIFNNLIQKYLLIFY